MRAIEIAVFMLGVFAVSGCAGVFWVSLGAQINESDILQMVVTPFVFGLMFMGSLGLLLLNDVHRKPTARAWGVVSLLLFVFSWFFLEIMFNFVRI